jgi:leucyl-tRNA synthetase
MKYPFVEIEQKWREIWEKEETYKTDLTDIEKKIYALVMFIYPSGAKLHIGHWYNYGPTDTWARFKKLQGYNVFEPMGYDAFGLPAENYAIKTGVHPQDSTLKNIEDIRGQLKTMGCMYDWNAELMTCVPEYYKWNQWLFLQLYKKGLAYRKNAPVNWCSSCNTVLANEQVQADGTCERCGTLVERKELTQWFFNIKKYADELLDGLDTIDWPEKTKAMQRNWIGKSTGTELDFKVDGYDEKISVFTTRPDTLFGVTYVVMAPEHPLVDKITTDEFIEKVNSYRNEVKSLSEIERTSTVKEKTGVPTGAFAINPMNGEKIPIWIADYALLTYGTGCVMAVPAHDERDFEFAKKFDLPIRRVIIPSDENEENELTEAYTLPGKMINSGEFNGMDSVEAKEAITKYLEKIGEGKATVNYRLRDWLISRQRYWGTPIPVVYCDKCGEVPVPEEDLPVKLPYDVDFKPHGASPLARNEKFINTTCPKCGGPAKRDADTMDTFVDSSWYYLRYLDPHFSDGMFNSEPANNWTPVDTYVGGAEHATMHLLYARFVHKFLRDLGLVNSDEPFKRLIHQGTITNGGAKMSKSKGNTVNPGAFIDRYGTDVFRMYMMFMGPYRDGGDWSDKGITGVDRFAQQTYQLFEDYKGIFNSTDDMNEFNLKELNQSEKAVYAKVNEILKRYSPELDDFRFNTVISGMMELKNAIYDNFKNTNDDLKAYVLKRFTTMLAPLAPHLAEEGWQMLGGDSSLFKNPVWFDYNEAALVVDETTVVVQINGKVRTKLVLPVDLPEDEVKQVVFADSKVQGYTDGKTIVKEIYIKNKIYNIVVK